MADDEKNEEWEALIKKYVLPSSKYSSKIRNYLPCNYPGKITLPRSFIGGVIPSDVGRYKEEIRTGLMRLVTKDDIPYEFRRCDDDDD